MATKEQGPAGTNKQTDKKTKQTEQNRTEGIYILDYDTRGATAQ